jgi:hypothetical protein
MPSCFVIMGYGKKTDFKQNKSFDLDKTYRNIVKPAVQAAGFTCERADEAALACKASATHFAAWRATVRAAPACLAQA